MPTVGIRSSGAADPWMMVLVAVLTIIGIGYVWDASTFLSNYHFGAPYLIAIKHVVSVVVGLLLLLLFSRYPSKQLGDHAFYIFLGSLPLVVATLIPHVGIQVNGAKRWLPFGLFNLQPSEFLKITFVLACARWFSRPKAPEEGHGLRMVLQSLAAVGGLFVLAAIPLMLQPDFGTTALLGALAWCMLLLGGVPIPYMLGPTAGGLALAFVAVRTSEYRWNRVMAFLDPEKDPLGAGYHLLQSLKALGSGGLTGRGIGASVSKSGYLPECHTDFIFAVFGEETGLVGGVFLLVVFGLLAWRGFRIAYRHEDSFAQLAAAGLTLVIVLQTLLNVGVALGAFPTKGMGLPFISYGGSSIMAYLSLAGLLLSMSRELRER